MRHLTFSLLAIAALLLAMASPLQAQDSGSQPTGTIAVEDSAEQDAAIATRIRDILAELEGYSDVTVTVSNGIVTLRGTTLEAAQATALNELVGRVEGVVTIENEVTETTDVVARLNPAVERFMERMTQIIAYGPLLIIAITAFVLIFSLGLWIARWRRPWDRIAPNAFIADIYRMLVRLAFLVGGVVVGLDILGATALLSTILGAAGIVGLAIGFAVRDTVENFIASIMLSIRQPFRPKDVVEINGDLGKVIRLTSRATILLSFDGNHIRIPNATVFKSRIVNYSRNAELRFTFKVGIEASADIEAMRSLTETVVTGLPFTLEHPAPATWIEEISDAGIILNVTGWIDQRESSLVMAKGEALRQVKAAIEAEGVEIPDTTYRLRFDTPASALAMLAEPAAAPTSQQAKATPAPAPAQNLEAVDVAPLEEAELEAMVEAERAETQDDDLLKEGGAQE